MGPERQLLDAALLVDDEQHRDLVQVVAQVHRRRRHRVPPLGAGVALDVAAAARLVGVEDRAVQLGDAGLGVRVVDGDPLPGLAVRSRRGLEGDLDALLDDLPGHRPLEVEPLAHGPGGREQLVGRERQQFGHGGCAGAARSAAGGVPAGEVAEDHRRADGAARPAVRHPERRSHDVAGGVQPGDRSALEVEHAGVGIDTRPPLVPSEPLWIS